MTTELPRTALALSGAISGPRACQKARLLKVTLIHISLKPPNYGLHLWDASLNFSHPWLMNWCYLFWNGVCPHGVKLLRTRLAWRAKLMLWSRGRSEPSVLHAVPWFWWCSPWAAQARDTHSNSFPGWTLRKYTTTKMLVDRSECHWPELNINVIKRYISGCALSLSCLAAFQAHNWITSCVPALKHCQATSLPAATSSLSPCCYFSLFFPFPTLLLHKNCPPDKECYSQNLIVDTGEHTLCAEPTISLLLV